ncbi:MAG: DNA-deoxyinosine glycosylase [Eubacteriales bacterium]|nr:DNA-deoxyinosine glycosylase [Eubacteriales bacterium]MDD4421588.1 DNA-deoxyinosine glycosylase [Eubacteriales bacterium]
MERRRIEHPFCPVFDRNSEILILGSLPSVKSRENSFYYGHPQNRFWKVTGAVFGEIAGPSIDEKISFLLKNHIALWDVISSCDIEGSSDGSIKNAFANDISVILNGCSIRHIFTNGKTAGKLYKKLIAPIIERDAVVLPSTSPANASFTTEMLVKAWEIIKK